MTISHCNPSLVASTDTSSRRCRVAATTWLASSFSDLQQSTRAILCGSHACSRSLTSFSDQALSPVPCPPMMTTLPPTAVALQQPIAFVLSQHLLFSFQLQLGQMQTALYTQRHDPQTHVLILPLAIALQSSHQISDACTVLQSADLLHVAQDCRPDTACSLDMTSAAIPEFLPRVLWQQAVTQDNSETTHCIAMYANAVHACTVSMQDSHLHCHVEQTLLFCLLQNLQQHNCRNAGMYSHKNSAQAQVTLQCITMCYASCQSACPLKFMDCIPASVTREQIHETNRCSKWGR